jgi:L-fuconate dehydratase
LTLESLNQGFNHFKVSHSETSFWIGADILQLKVGADPEDDLRRGLLIRSIIDDPKNLPAGRTIDPATIEGKNAGPAGCVLMVDANRECHIYKLNGSS